MGGIYLNLYPEEITIEKLKFTLWTKREFIPLVMVEQKGKLT